MGTLRRLGMGAVCLAAVGCGRPAADHLAAVDSLFSRFDRPDAPGCAVGASRDGKVILAKGYGQASLELAAPVTPQTAFNIGSVGKQFTALAVLLLEREQRLSLDDDVRKYLPELPDYGTPIRVRDLLWHTSGLRDYGTLEVFGERPVHTGADFLRLMSRQRGLNFAPGSRHEYSHSDYTVLGMVVERAAAEPLGDFLTREIWAPLGMTSTRLNDDRHRPIPGRATASEESDGVYRVVYSPSTVVGGTNVYTTIDDLLRWERNFHAATVGGPALLARLVERPLLPSGEAIPYAYGLWLGEYRGLQTVYRGGGGGGFHTQMIRFPSQAFAVFVLCNAPAPATALAEAVAGLFLAPEMAPMPADSTKKTVATPAADAGFAGVYRVAEAPWDIVRITFDNGVLHEVIPDATYPLVKLENGQYQAEGVFYRFAPRTQGRGAHLTITAKDLRQEYDQAPTAELWRPAGAVLRRYAGSYYSPDIDAVWDIGLERDTLKLRRAAGDVALVPVVPGAFVGNYHTPDGRMFPLGIEVAMEPGATGLLVTGLPNFEVVRRLRFDRR